MMGNLNREIARNLTKLNETTKQIAEPKVKQKNLELETKSKERNWLSTSLADDVD